MNRYLLLRLRHSLFLVRDYLLFALLMILALTTAASAARTSELHVALPIISKTFTAYQAKQQKAAEIPSKYSSQEATLEIPPLTLQSQSITENGTTDGSDISNISPSNALSNDDGAKNKGSENKLPQNRDQNDYIYDFARSPIVLYSPLVFSYWEQLQEEQVMSPKLTAQEIVNNEFLHDTITDLISQHETPIDETIELLSVPIQTTANANTTESTPVTSEIAITDTPIEILSIATPVVETSNDTKSNDAPDLSTEIVANQESLLREPVARNIVESAEIDKTETLTINATTASNTAESIQIYSANLNEEIPNKGDLITENLADENSLVKSTESIKQDAPLPITDADSNINSTMDSEKNATVEQTDEFINHYLLYALFPHHKKSVIEAPLSKSYKENHDVNDNHESDLSIIKLVDKIDHSLSFNDEMNDEAMEGTIDEDAGLETELTESYFDSYQNYQQHYQTLDEDDVLSLESQAYPYVQDLQLEEALSSAEFEDLSINQQIEQLLTTGDYYILADDVVKGRQYYIQAVRIGAKDKNSPIYAKALVKLADLEENPYLARFQYTNALDIYETHVGFDMEIADILIKLVLTFDVTTERIVIYELLTRAKQILEKYTYSPQYTMVLRNLAIYYEAVDDFENADSNYQAALALDLEYLTTNDIRTILALENYAAFYLKFREYQKAEEILLFKLRAHEEAETIDYYNLGRTQSMLGWTYLQLKNYDDALHYYNAALGNINYSITKNRFMPHYYSLPAIFDLIYFFNITEDPERGVPYFEVAQALLNGENEASVLDYLKETPKEVIDLGRIVNYPWAATAEVEGLIAMMHYIDKQ